MSVVSQSNQQMLFELLKSISTDNQLQINERALEQFITQRCAYFHTNRFELEIGNNINELNKKIVEQGYNFIMSNQPRQKVPQKQTPQLSKREMFDVGLANQEAHLKKMINPKKPKKIDFTDGSEDFPIQNMERVMNQTLADRQKELESITQKYSSKDKQKAEKWLNMDENTPKIKIERTSNIKLDNTINVNPEKRVTFNIQESNPPSSLSNLFSKLKQKKPVSNDDIINKLDTIISNQEKIMKMFSTIKGEKGEKGDTGATGMPRGILH